MNWDSWFEHLRRDIFHAFRSLWNSPAFALPAVITLALGIGATTAIFSAVYSVLLKPLPYSKSGEIYSVEVVIPERGDATLPVRVQDYLEWRKAPTVFSDVAALTPAEWNLTGTGDPERIGGAFVSSNFFPFLGTPMAHGRGFAADEEQPGKDKVVVISDALWRRRYGSDPNLVGKSITLDGQSYEVVGIASPSLVVPTGTLLHPLLAFSTKIDIWKPIAPTKEDLEGENWNFGLLARLKPGASVEQGQVQLQQMLNAAIRAVAPEVKTELKTRLVPIHEIYARRSQLRLLLVLGASVLLLLAACTNIVNLLLARIASQATETATRIALGASKARIMIHMVVESVVLALIGGALGIAIAEIGTRTLLTYAPDDVRLLTDNHLNLPVLLFSFAVSLLAGLACGILPAAQAFRRDIAVALQEGARTAFGGSRRARFHQVLIGVEIALSTLLLLSAGLLLHSFIKIMRADRGYEVNNIVTANIGVSGSRYSTDQQRNLFFQQLAQNIRAVPGVKAAGAISHLPAVAEAGITRTIFYANDTDFQGTVLHRPVAAIRSVVSGYLAASGISLRAGRMVSEQDQTPVAMISESLARQLWSGEPVNNAVGRTLREGDVKAPLIQVVGVVEDVRAGALDHDLPPLLYVPYQQFADEHMTLVMRTTMDQASAAAVLRAQVRNLDPTLPILSIDSMRQILLTSVSQRVFQMILTCVFALVALVLGSVGVYGVVSYSIACRTRDIGMRFALGAMRADVMRWLFGSTFRSIVIGHIIGLLGAVLCAGIFRSLLFGVGPLDPLSIGAVAAVLLLASALACYLPARRAAQLDPITALRHE